MKTKLIRLACFLTALLALATMVRAQGSAFTYQGRLSESGAPAQGVYDFEFRVFDAETGGTQQGATVTSSALDVTNGLFTVTLNPGAGVFTGLDRWLEIGVVTTGGGAFTTLAPRQSLTPTPYAIRAVEAGYAGAAATAGSFTGPLAGDVAGPQGATSVALVGGESAANVAAGAGAANAATSANTPNTLVKRDGSGNFSVGDIIATSFSGSGAGLTSLNAAVLTGTIADAQMSANVSLLGASIEAAEITDGTITPADLNLPDFNPTFWQATGNAGTTAGTHFLGTTDNQVLEFKVNNQRGLRLEPTAIPAMVNLIGGSLFNSVAAGAYGVTISGGHQNEISAGAPYATIGGGVQNKAGGLYSTIGGGNLNEVGGGYATVPGGAGNTAGGDFSFAAGHDAKALHNGAFVWADSPAGGFSSTANDQFLIRAAGGVGIGTNNPNGAALAVTGNVMVNGSIGRTDDLPLELTVNGQRGLRLEPTASPFTVNVIGGSMRNVVGAGAVGATIGGGGAGIYAGNTSINRVDCDFGTVSGGGNNTIEASPDTGHSHSTIGGGVQNTIQSNVDCSTIGGGGENAIQIFLQYSTIDGGYRNKIQNYADYAAIGGGRYNTIEPDGDLATIGGGRENIIKDHADHAMIGGGGENTILTNGSYATIPGGRENSATNYAFAAGRRAKANHTGAFVWADSTDTDFASTAANQFSIRAAGGVRLSDSTPSLSFGNTTRQMLNLLGTSYAIGVQSSSLYFRCDNAAGTDGFIWYKGGSHEGGYAQPGAGGTELMHLIASGLYATSFNPTSDRNAKEDFAPVSPQDILAKVVALPITRWQFKQDSGTRHLGPMAQDFYAAFNIGPDDKHIATVDADGVALAAIQGLNEKVESRNQKAAIQMEELKAENAELRNELSDLKQLVQAMSHKLNGGAK